MGNLRESQNDPIVIRLQWITIIMMLVFLAISVVGVILTLSH